MQKVVILLLALLGLTVVTAKLEEVFNWKEIDWTWRNDEEKNSAIINGIYIPGNSMPNGILRWKDKLFVTIPRWKPGVVSTLNYVSLNSSNPSPTLMPYPDWDSNRLSKNNKKSQDETIVSIFRIDVDPCDRLWVLDTGMAEKIIHPPTLMIFDLKTDTLIRRYRLKPEHYSADSPLFINTIVDATADKCDQAFAYLPDIDNHDIIVYSFAENNSWKVKHNYFSFEPLKGDFNLEGINFQWDDGVFALALGSVDKNGFRTAYFHSLVSTHEFSVNTRVLKNKTLATDSVLNYHLFKYEGKKGRDTHSTSSAFDLKKGILFLSLVVKDGVGCWNPRKTLNADNFGLVVQDHERLLFPNDIKIDQERNLWILSDKMPTFTYGKLDPNKINFRVLRIPVDEALKGSVCEE